MREGRGAVSVVLALRPSVCLLTRPCVLVRGVYTRVVKGFMIQGGDPTGTGRGGESCWGKDPFKDEFDRLAPAAHTFAPLI